MNPLTPVRLVLSSILLAAVAAACSCRDAPVVPPIPAPEVPFEPPEGCVCVPDAALLAETTECSTDMHCPCGSHCVAGLCASDCIAHDDCSDGWCDPFGRCRSTDDADAIPRVQPRAGGELVVTPRHVEMYDLTLEKPVFVGARHQDLSSVRLAADPGLLVRCDGGDWADECELTDVRPDDVEVRAHIKVEESSEANQWRLAVFAADQLRTVRLSRAERKTIGEAEPGVYRGQIWLTGAAVRLTTEEEFVHHESGAEFQILRLPLELKLYDDGTLVLRDGATLLSGVLPASWVFRLGEMNRFDAMEGDVDLSFTRFLGAATSPDPAATDVTFSTTGELEAFAGHISGSLTTAVGGLGLIYAPPFNVDERLRVRWAFSAERESDILTDELPPPLGSGEAPAWSVFADRWDHPTRWADEVASCGLVGTGQPRDTQVEHHICFAHGGGLNSVALAHDPAGLTALGDLECTDDGVPRKTIFPLFTYLEQAAGLPPAQLLTTRQMLDSCIADLTYVHGDVGAPLAVGEQPGACIDRLSDTATTGRGRCVDGPLALRAIQLALEAVEREGVPDEITVATDDTDSARLAHRLLQQWVQLHTFVAREAAQENDALFGADMAELTAALELSLKGWDVVLHPAVIGRLLHLPPELLREPDYRGVTDPAATMSEDVVPAVGVSVAFVDALQVQLAAAEKIVHRARFENADIPDVVREAYRYAAVVSPIAGLLYDRAMSAGEVPWWRLYVDAAEGYSLAQRGLMDEWRAYESGRNPLGIEDTDLPLYRGLFNPDEAGVRFSAISSYLIDNWADTAVADAEGARTAAETAWSALLERQLQRARSDDDSGRRVEDIKRQYGEKVLTLCGNPLALTDAADVFEAGAWPNLSPQNCFMNPLDRACRHDEGELLEQLSGDDVAKHLCVVAGLKSHFGPKVELSNDDVWDKVNELQGDINGLYEADTWEFWKDAIDPGLIQYGEDFVSCAINAAGCELQDLLTLEYPTDYESDADSQAFMDSRNACGAAIPNGQLIPDKLSPLDKPDCYSGTIGELALAARAAAKDVEVAAGDLGDEIEAYETAVNQCVIANRGLEQIEAVGDQLGDLSGRLQTYMDGVGFVAELGGVVVGAVDSLAGLFSPVPKKDGGGSKLGRYGTGGAGGKLYDFASGKILEMGDKLIGLGEINDLHAGFVAEWSDKITDALCFNEAAMHLVSADTSAKRVERAQVDLSRAILEMRNNQAQLARYIAEGQRRVSMETARGNASLVNDIWHDLWVGDADSYRGRTEAFRRRMRIAQRMVYLAVRAVEYEWQVSREDRATVLAATTPEQLRVVLDNLETDVGAGNLGGQSPENLHVVVSVREHLLQLADRSAWPDGQNTCGSREQLRAQFTSPRYAYYDADGTYAGQLIPLSIAPLGVLGVGDASGIPLLTGADCAERVWSVNATLQGDDLVDDDASFTRIELLQRNTFYSQWCAEPGDGQPLLQSSSVRPSRNLFKDPVWAGEFGNQTTDESEYVRARVQAYHNVSRADFETEAYGQGSSEELAARGLFGEYALFFPAEYLDVDGDGGLHLNRLDDVLLRVDYVSAAKRW